jgi:hypothetical protein
VVGLVTALIDAALDLYETVVVIVTHKHHKEHGRTWSKEPVLKMEI